MRSSRFLALSLAFICSIAVALPVLAGDDPATKKARESLKKNEKALAVADSYEGEDDAALLKAGLLVTQIREADNAEALTFLLQVAEATQHNKLYDIIKEQCGLFTSDDAVKGFNDILSKKDKKVTWKQRALAAMACEKVANPKITDALLAALKSSDEADVLNPAIIAAGKREDKRVVAALVDVLKKVEKAGGWEYHHVRQALVQLTGQDFFTYETWKKWWDGNKDTFEFGKKGEAKEAKTQERVGAAEKKPQFFNTEVKSNRFCFVIDVSGSMKMVDLLDSPDDPVAIQKAQDKDPTDEMLKNARIERAKTELKRAIAALDPTVRFNILSFSDKFATFSPDIAPANEPTKKAAIAWVDALKADGGTFTDDAFRRAFEFTDIDTIYFLSDGAPQKKAFGKGQEAATEQHQREMMKTCYDLIEKERRFRSITIHTFGLCGLGIWFKKWGERPPSLSLDPKTIEPLRDFMKKCAEMTGGAFKSL